MRTRAERMGWMAWRAAAFAGLLLWMMGGHAALTAAETALVRDIRVRNARTGSLDESFVRAHISHPLNQPLDISLVRHDTEKLNADHRISEARVFRETMEGGIRLVYEVKLRYRLAGPPTIAGNDAYRDTKVREWLGLTRGDLVDEQIVGHAAQQVKKEYRDGYFPDVEVTAAITPSEADPDLADLTLTIDEGKRSSVARLVYKGNAAVARKEFRRSMKLRAWYNPMRWFGRHQFDRGELEAGCLAIRDIYRDRGYLDARVRLGEIRRDEDMDLIVEVLIDEGPHYRVESVSIAGVTLYPESDIRRTIKNIPGTGALEPGVVASQSLIGRAASLIRDYYGARGHIRTRVKPVIRTYPERGRVDIRFDVDEGTLTHIRNIQIRGNSRTKDKVIRRELSVQPGGIYDEVEVRRSEQRVRNLGFFSDVRSYDERFNLLDESEVDLVLDVEEKYTGQFMVGAGFSSVDRLMGFVEVSQGNFDLLGWPYFTGGGQKVRLRAQFGTRRKNYLLSFTEPWLFNRKLSLGLDAYHSEYDYSNYDLDRTGASVTLGRSLPGPHRALLRYGVERISLVSAAGTNLYVDLDTDATISFVQPRTEKSYMRLTLVRDTRDRSFIPSSGLYARLFGEVTGGPLGMDLDLFRVGLNARRYFALPFGHVFSARVRYESVEPFGDTDEVPISERLFIGGGRTLRGFEYRDVGPKAVLQSTLNPASHRPYGGQSLALASVEYTIPVIPKIRLAAFYDIGNVWLDSYEMDTDSLASSAGAGVRLDLPGFPIRLDYAWILDRDDEMTDEEQFIFWIGYDP